MNILKINFLNNIIIYVYKNNTFIYLYNMFIVKVD